MGVCSCSCSDKQDINEQSLSSQDIQKLACVDQVYMTDYSLKYGSQKLDIDLIIGLIKSYYLMKQRSQNKLKQETSKKNRISYQPDDVAFGRGEFVDVQKWYFNDKIEQQAKKFGELRVQTANGKESNLVTLPPDIEILIRMKEKVTANYNQKMGHTMKDISKKTYNVDREKRYTLMEISILGNSKMVCRMDKGSIIVMTKMQIIREIGKIIKDMEMEKKNEKMDLVLVVNILKEKDMERMGSSNEEMEIFIKENFKMTSFKAKESTYELTEENLKETDLITKCMDQENLFGEMEKYTKVVLLMIKKKVMEYQHDQMVIFNTGKKFIGDWLNGKQHGNGKVISETGSEKQGIWENGKRIKWITQE